MEDLVIVGTTQARTQIYLSELSSTILNENGIEGRGGLYLYEEVEDISTNGIRVLAEVPDVGAAYRLLDLMGVTAAQA